MGRHRGTQYSHGQTQGVTVQPWADTGYHSTAMGRHKGSQLVQPWENTGGHNTAMGRHKGSQLVQPWADTGGHNTALGRHRWSQYSHGQKQGFTVQLRADRSGQRTAIGRHTRGQSFSLVPRALLTDKFHRRRSWPQHIQA